MAYCLKECSAAVFCNGAYANTDQGQRKTHLIQAIITIAEWYNDFHLIRLESERFLSTHNES